jgi:hypothetical protein
MNLFIHVFPGDIRIAGTAPAALGLATDGCCRKAISCLVIDCPRGVVGTSEGATTVTATWGIWVGQGRVVGTTRSDGLTDGGLARPSAGRLAAIPVTSRLTGLLGSSECREESRKGEADEGLGNHGDCVSKSMYCVKTIVMNLPLNWAA